MDDNDQIRQIALRLRELEDSNAALTRRVYSLETELARVTGRPSMTAPQAPPPLPAVLPPMRPVLPAVVAPPPPLAAEPALVATPPESPGIERNVGLTWINRIGVLTLVLGVGFFFKYMVDNDWIGPSGRVILGVLAGMLTIWAGDLLWHRDQKTFAQGIQALGTSILYLSFFAAFRFYELIPQMVAFVLMLMTTLMTGALALRYNARATIVLGLLGGYATPFLLSKGEPNDLFFLSYLFLLNTGAMFVARMKGWTSVEAIAFAGTWLIHFGWTEDRSRIAGRNLAAVFTLLNYGVATLSPQRWLVLTAQVVSGIVLGYGYRTEWHDIVSILLVVHFLAGLYVANRKNFAGGSLAAVFGFWLGQATAEQPRMNEHVTLLFSAYTWVFVSTLAYAAFRAARERLHKLDLVAASLCGVIYFTASGALLETEYKAYLGLLAVAVAAGYLGLGYALYTLTPAGKRDTTGPLLAAGLALAFLAIAVPIQLTGYRITIGWSIQAAALAWIAYKLRDARILLGSAALYFLAISRLGTIDALLYWPPIEGGYTLFFNPRFLTFLCVCLSLWFSAWCASKFDETLLTNAAGLAYIAGHLFMIWGLHLEFFAYVDSRADLTSPRSLKTLISSVLLAGYGLLFISAGFARRAALPRILGLILFGIVVVKLYIYDVWLLDRIYRMLAFIALGGLLVAGSYLYSRFRDKLSTLVRNDPS
jgi:uncharacterized membrane protein